MRVLLVEKDYYSGAAIKKVLEKNKYIVDLVADGTEAWNKLNSDRIEYSVAIFNWVLPNLSGIELIKKLRKNNNSLPVLLLTIKNSLQDKVTGLDAGADDYLVKPFRMPELLARLRALQRRSPCIILPQLKLGNLILDYSTYTVSVINKNSEKQDLTLTAKEFQLLEYLMRHPQQILTSDRLLVQIWSDRTSCNSNVVAVQIRLLRRKLAVYRSCVSIETVYGLGYRLQIEA